MLGDIKHQPYKGHDIRSSPRKDLKEEKWKIRIDVTFPPIHGTTSMRECLDEKDYLTLDDAHAAGFEYGHRLIDEQLQGRSGSIPSK